MNYATVKNLGLAGAAGLIVGALLPWATLTAFVGSVSKNGIEGDGIFTAAMGLIALFVVLAKKEGEAGKAFSIPVAILGILSGALIAYDWSSLTSVDGEGIIIQTGIGVYLTLIAAILLIVAGFTKPT